MIPLQTFPLAPWGPDFQAELGGLVPDSTVRRATGFSPSAIAVFVKLPLGRIASLLWAYGTQLFWWQQSSGQNLSPVL